MKNRTSALRAFVSLALVLAIFIGATPAVYAASSLAVKNLTEAPAANGTAGSPVSVASPEDAAVKYLKLNGFDLGRMYYKLPGGKELDVDRLMTALASVYPFLITLRYGSSRDGVYFEVTHRVEKYFEPAVEEAKRVVDQLTSIDMGYIEKLGIIHDYIVSTTAYDDELYEKYISGDQNGDHESYSAYGVLINKKGMCEGYANAFYILCTLADIPAFRVSGTGNGGGHSWNAVYLFGRIYYVDATFDDPSPDTPGRISREFFMKTEAEMKSKHVWDSTALRQIIPRMYSENLPAAQALCELGLFKGTGQGFDLERAPTRSEAAAMLVRLLGAEGEALSVNYPHPFEDVSAWASPYVGYLYQYGLTTGISETKFDGENKTSLEDYLTFILRSLGYDDKAGDFTWAESKKAASALGLLDGGYDTLEVFTRGNLADLSYRAIRSAGKDGIYMLDRLLEENAVDANRVENLIAYTK